MDNCKTIVVGSSNVIFTYSYILSLKEVSDFSGLVDIGEVNVELPSFIDKNSYMRYKPYKKSKVKIIKKILKALNLDRSSITLFILSLLEKIKTSNVIAKENLDLSAFLERTNPDVILYLWSTTPKTIKAEIDTYLNNRKLNCKQFLIVNTYPIRSNLKIYELNSLAMKDKGYFASFDKVVVTSEIMKAYLHNNCSLNPDKMVIHQDRLHSSFFSTRAANSFSVNSKVIFLGNTNFSERTIDDVSSTLKLLADKGVEIWIQDNGEKISAKNIKYFKPFNYEEMYNGRLSEFLSDFDAVLMLYNNLNNARSNISYPTRFALGTLGRIPLILKRGNYQAIEEIYANSSGIILYDSQKQLEKILLDKDMLVMEKHKIKGSADVCADLDYNKKFINKLND